MRLSFKQGIVRYQQDSGGRPLFLVRSSPDPSYVDLVVSPDPTIITFAHRSANYLVEEAKTVERAWGPFGNETRYLYWDIDLGTGALTRGATAISPLASGVAPTNPAPDAHWFDTINSVMHVWVAVGQTGKWVEKLRVFAGTYFSSNNIKPQIIGSQAGLFEPIEAGNIFFDSFNKPLRQSDGTFVTSVTGLNLSNVATKRIKFETETLDLLATENIAKFTCVQMTAGRRIKSAFSSNYLSRVSGVTTEDLYKGEVGTVVSNGLIRSESFQWSAAAVNKPVFCAADGSLTVSPPTAGVLQQVGFVYDTDAVYVNIFPPIVLDHPDGINIPTTPVNGAPSADFSVAGGSVSGNAPFTVSFIDASTNFATAWEWDFNGDGIVESTAQNPTFIFTNPGVYTVRLKSTNNLGSDTEVKQGFITVLPAVGSVLTTNLEVKMVVAGKSSGASVRTGETFQVQLNSKNDGLLTATNVRQTVFVHDSGTFQTTIGAVPQGTSIVRFDQYTQLIFPQVSSMDSGSSGTISFFLQAPNVARPIILEASITSPEQDSTMSDNFTSYTVRVQS